MRTISLEDATGEQLQTAARSIGGDERGLMNIIEADDVTPEEETELRVFLAKQGVTAITDDNGFVRVVRR